MDEIHESWFERNGEWILWGTAGLALLTFWGGAAIGTIGLAYWGVRLLAQHSK